uniref:Uncharacterized protein n=1 Tax=Timema tahoe TaxID=61484 RepID=A0A7R9P057_9NEOP|nr:unnamed protein product [Timema tahoe]
MFAGLKNKIKEETGSDPTKLVSPAQKVVTPTNRGRHSRQGSGSSVGSISLDGAREELVSSPTYLKGQNSSDLKLPDGKLPDPASTAEKTPNSGDQATVIMLGLNKPTAPSTSNRAPDDNNDLDQAHTPPMIMENVVITMLSEMRKGPKARASKRTNLFVKPGSSISFEEYEKSIKATTSGTSTVASKQTKSKSKSNNKNKTPTPSSSDSEDFDMPSDLESFMDVSILSSDPGPDVLPVKVYPVLHIPVQAYTLYYTLFLTRWWGQRMPSVWSEEEWRRRLTQRDEEWSRRLDKKEEEFQIQLQEHKEEWKTTLEVLEREKSVLEEEKLEIVKQKLALEEALRASDEYKKKVFQYQEDLDQLEGFQTQEMAKIKHLLLVKEQEVAERVNTLKESSSQIEQLKSEVNRLRRYEEEYSNLQEDMETLRHSSGRERSQLASTLAQSEEEVRHLRDRVAVLERRTSGECAGLGAQLTVDERVQSLLGERTLLERRLEEAHLHLTDIKGSWSEKISQLETQVGRLSRQAGEEGVERRRAEGERSALLERVKALEVIVERGRSAARDKEELLLRVRAERDALADELKEVRGTHDAQMEELQRQITAAATATSILHLTTAKLWDGTMFAQMLLGDVVLRCSVACLYSAFITNRCNKLDAAVLRDGAYTDLATSTPTPETPSDTSSPPSDPRPV